MRLGLLLAVTSAFSFGLSGALASAMIDSGWSAGAAVTVRMGVGAAALAVPTAWAMRGRWRRALNHKVVVYGVVAVAGAQLCYFSAVGYLPVAVALLIEYTSPVAVMTWLWLRHRQAPSRVTVLGAVVALTGLPLLLNALNGGADLDPRGVGWAFAAMIGATVYFLISSDVSSDVPAVGLAGLGLAIGAVTVVVAGAAGVVPLHASQAPIAYRDVTVAWFVPVLALGVVTAALAYLTGIAGARRLGARLASFVGLSEVLAALVFAWLLLAELPRPSQLAGAALVVIGVALVKAGEREVETVLPAV